MSTCAGLFARMLDTVPNGVVLTEVIEPLPVKPKGVALTFMGDGTFSLRGEVRVRHFPNPRPCECTVFIHVRG